MNLFITDQSVDFSYLAFGHESETGTNQNELNIACSAEDCLN